jgi:hypothetical protein
MVTLRKESEVKAKQAADADRAAIAARTLRPYSTKSAEVAIRDVLRDSDSARFTDVTRNPKTGAVCGKLNAKNAYGGYVGAAPFIYFYDPDEKTGQILMDPKIADTHTIPYIEAFCSPE